MLTLRLTSHTLNAMCLPDKCHSTLFVTAQLKDKVYQKTALKPNEENLGDIIVLMKEKKNMQIG